MDTELRRMGGFKLHGADIAQSLMKPVVRQGNCDAVF